jgi:Uma2 family endonuclease
MSTTKRQVLVTTVLTGVPYQTYVALRDHPGNDHLRMTYHDGTLEIMSPTFRHENVSSRLGLFVHLVAYELGIPYGGSRCTTFRRAGDGPRKGKGKEPDESFYFRYEPIIRGKDTIDLDAGDPPPDLWVEVDNRASSAGKLPVYATLGVPEVWRYRARKKTLAFLSLDPDGTYQSIDRSLCLPMLTPDMVLEALALGEGQSTFEWQRRLRVWIDETLRRPGGGV